MTPTEIITSIDLLCEKLDGALSSSEIAAGWSETRQREVQQYLRKLKNDLANGVAVPHLSIVRTLDSVGICDGALLDEICGIANEINALKRPKPFTG